MVQAAQHQFKAKPGAGVAVGFGHSFSIFLSHLAHMINHSASMEKDNNNNNNNKTQSVLSPHFSDLIFIYLDSVHFIWYFFLFASVRFGFRRACRFPSCFFSFFFFFSDTNNSDAYKLPNIEWRAA